MSGLFGPKPQKPLPVVNPADTQNRLADALARRLASGGSNADQVSSDTASTAGSAKLPTLTGLN